MRMFPRERNLYSLLSTERNCTGSKSLGLWRKLVRIGKGFLSAPYIPHSTVLKKKDSLNLGGGMKVDPNEEEQEDGITNLQKVELPPLMQSKHFEQISWLGSRSDLSSKELLDLEKLARFLEEQEAKLQLFGKASALAKRGRKYLICNPEETWASRWVAAPIAYLFPEEQREYWLGDLYGANQEMLRKGYPLLLVMWLTLAKLLF